MKIVLTIILILAFPILHAQVYNTGELTVKTANDTLHINADFTNVNGAILSNNGNVYIKGNLKNEQVSEVAGSGIIFLNGIVRQSLYSTAPVPRLTLNNTNGNVILTASTTVSAVLNFIKGKILTDTATLIIASTASVTNASQTSGWVIGKLQKSYLAGTSANTFEVGDTLAYSPAVIAFSNVTTSGNLIASVTALDHSQISYSGIDYLKSVNRFWYVKNNGIVFSTASATFNFTTADKDPGASTANFKIGLYDGSNWILPTVNAPLSNSIQAVNLTSFGDFIIGERVGSFKWTGEALTTEWHTAKNWLGGVPTQEFNTLIPNGILAGRFYPILNTGTGYTKNITIESAASLHVSGAHLNISGSIANTGILNSISGTVTFSGSTAQSIPANAFTGNKILNLFVNNDVSLAGKDTLLGSVSVAAGKTFATNNNLVLKSNANRTARISALPVDASGNATAFITGNVGIERYIPLRKAWRLLSAPLKTTGAPTINAAWQEGLTTASPNPNMYPGYGVHIMGGTVANGFDQSPTNAASIMILNQASGQFTPLPQSTTYLPITTYPGYFLYVRGDRSINLMQGLNAGVTSTTLRMNGQVNTGKQVSVVNATGYTVFGNPFASAVDFQTITKSNVKNAFYVWDPKLSGSYGLGGYVTFIWNVVTSSYDATSSVSPLSKFIQSGQAVLISSLDLINPGLLSVNESDKTVLGDDEVFGRTNGMNQQVRVNLYSSEANGTRSLLDGVLSTYDVDNSNEVNADDANKVNIATAYIGLLRGGATLAVERRKAITLNDTTFLVLGNLKQQNYNVDIEMNNMTGSLGMVAFIRDRYSSTIDTRPLDLDGITNIQFSINADPASYASDRFSIIFKVQGPLPVTFKTIKASRQQDDVMVEWATANEVNVKEYHVERSGNERQFVNMNTTAAGSVSGGSFSYQFLDIKPLPGNNFYRIRSLDFNGHTGYSSTVMVTIEPKNKLAALMVQPNLVTGNSILMHILNVAEGDYQLKLYNASGQLIVQQTISHKGLEDVRTLQVNTFFPPGTYELELSGNRVRYISPFIKK